VADVFELPHFANYFGVQDGPCEISATNRRSVHAVCKAPAVLIRRELFYPGWHAFVNDHPSAIARYASIFQAVHLPAGDSNVLFSYAPTHIRWACLAGITGLMFLLSGIPTLSMRLIRKQSSAGSQRHESYSTA
jgi:hypothetical protein